ncbi:phosphomannomutase/phosphoglucomutase [Anaeroselena agilis]|uniref:Phosphomannomutase/phosphoglucomutase n=1 Tax=Anaeroselena agilis TaxID=3063788 RepID=A0ABU3NVU1_9FIRM|nr:phosphomannomutase/phosphoglucomutase [Selenomonadales bacterium 4137-cl]
MGLASPGIFRQYDIRGVHGHDLTTHDAELIGRAFGTFLRNKGEKAAIVGRDNRASSPELREQIVKGLRESGIDVIDIGVVISPVFYYSTHLFDISGGVMITASHNPSEYNGFKIQYDGRTLYGDELLDLKQIIDKGEFAHGEGSISLAYPEDDYISHLKEKLLLGDKRLKVVVDCGNGTASLFAPRLLYELGCDVIPLYCESDSSFPNHFPDPVKIENLQQLIKAVRENRADVGLGFDGDGDRLGVVDDRGNIIWGDMLMILFWREILPKYPGADALVEVKCSNLLFDEIKRLGGNPFFYKTGHSLIKAKMKEIKAVFAGEMSGHMFFADEYYGFDDALYAAGRLLRILSHSAVPLSQLLADVPKTFITPELRVKCSDADKFKYVENAKRYFSKTGHKFIDIDGVRAIFEKGWGLVRASNTGPEVIMRCEADSELEFTRIKDELFKAINYV